MPIPVRELGKYGLAVAGTAGSAGAQFLLTLLLLHRVMPEDFGRFAFLMLVAQFIWAIGGALFSAPLARLELERAVTEDTAGRHGLVIANHTFALAAATISTLAAIVLHQPLSTALIYGAFVGIGLLRLFARVAAYTQDRQDRVIAADAAYVCGLAAGIAAMLISPLAQAPAAYAVFLASSLLGLAPLAGFIDFRMNIGAVRNGLKDFAGTWRRYSRWSLIGVVATEATANAHSYIVTIFLGPQAFVPIAASSVLLRPCTVSLNALSELERARIANDLAHDRADLLAGRVRFFRAVAVAIWIATVIAIILVLAFLPGLIFNPGYDRKEIALGAALWAAVLLLRVLYIPEAVALQAYGAFGALAYPKIWAAPVSIGAVVLLLWLATPVWSLLGIALGELLAAILIFKAARRAVSASLAGTART